MSHLLIRTDATTKIGMGHLMRCLALAQVWKDRCGQVIFVTNFESDALKQRLYSEGFHVIGLERSYPEPGDWKTISVVLAEHPNAWVVLDGYHFDTAYQRRIKEADHPLLVIDDMAHLDHYHADILLNQNINASKLNYSCGKDTVQLLGCDYAILRQVFLEYRNWKRQIPEKAKKILITMGGADPDNVTLKVIRALNSLNDPALEVKIVAGPANQNINSLEKELHLSPFTFHLSPSVSNMPELMAWADVAISAGGSTCWEIAFMGLPSLIITLADNQAGIAEGLDKAGAGIDLGSGSQRPVPGGS